MAGGYCLRWTAWRIWMHPRKAYRQMEEADGVQEDLNKRLEEALNLLEAQRKETAAQTLKIADLTRQLTETDKALADEHRGHEETRLKLTKALDALAEQKSVDEKLAEFEQELSKVEDLKRGYEKRITELEARLGDARKRLSIADDRELMDSIDMAGDSRRYPSTPPKLRPNGAQLRPNVILSRPGVENRRRPTSSGFINRDVDSPHPSAKDTPALSDSKDSASEAEVIHLEESVNLSEEKSGPNEAASKSSEKEGDAALKGKNPDKIEGSPEETSGKVADYLYSLQKGARERKAGRSEEDWLSDLPDL